MSKASTHPGIVVGVDGSPGPNVAVQWAARDAELRNVPLTLVHVVPATAGAWLESSMAPAWMGGRRAGKRPPDAGLPSLPPAFVNWSDSSVAHGRLKRPEPMTMKATTRLESTIVTLTMNKALDITTDTDRVIPTDMRFRLPATEDQWLSTQARTSP